MRCKSLTKIINNKTFSFQFFLWNYMLLFGIVSSKVRLACVREFSKKQQHCVIVIINKQMGKLLISGLIISFILLANAQVLNSWASPLSAVTMHPTFITTANIGTSISGTVTVSASQAYTVYFYRPNQYYPNNPAFQLIQLKGSDKFVSRPVDTTGLWRIEILAKNRNESFLLLVTVGEGKAVERYVQVARRQKLLVGYFQQGQNCNFSVKDIAFGQERDYFVEMYYGGHKMDFTRGTQIFNNSGMTNTQYEVSCVAPAAGYYYIYLSVSENIMPLFPRVLVNYQSGIYPCPAPSTYRDVGQIFTTCVQVSSNAAFPCVKFDNAANVCSQCHSSYILQEGNCYLGKDCGLDQYFHFGACLPALENCMNFKQIGGECLECVNGYTFAFTQNGKICIPIPNPLMQAPTTIQTETPQTITTTTETSGAQSNTNRSQTTLTTNNTTTSIQTASNSSNRSQSSTNQSNIEFSNSPTTPSPKKPPTITCQQGTYQFNGLCALYPPFCTEFETVQRVCTSCAKTYTLDPSTLNCIPIRVNCLPFFTNIGNTCVPFPKHCNSTNAFGNCTSCLINYTLEANGTCILKQCAPRQYLSNNKCLPVSANCQDYDPYLGNCLSCRNNLVLSGNGTCEAPNYSQMVSNGCRPRQYRLGNTCNNVDPSCNLFDQYSGACLSCIDPAKLLDRSTGKCYSVSQVCAQRYYLDPITRNCQQVSSFCDSFNPSNGYCTSCKHGLTLFRGACMLLTPCRSNQYRNQDGVCTDADPNCDGVDQGTGGCIACQPGYEINPGGVCCFAQNYLLSASCKAFLSVNCASQRPIFLNCQQCEPGYSLVNGVFGRCSKA